MYLFAKKITKNNNIAIIAGVMYIVAPYRFTDMYIRNALAELTSFVFLPIVFLGLYNLFDDNNQNFKKVFIPLIIGATGLFLTHTVLTMYTAIFALIYVLINYKKIKNKKILISLIISIVLILMLTAFFWMPLLELKHSANYEVFKEGRMERTEVLIAYKLDFYRLFFTLKNDYMHYEIGLITLIGIILTPIAIKRIKQEKYYPIYLFFIVAGITSVVMTLKVFPFEHLPSILKMLQFSFRMLEFSSFFFSFVAAINIGILSKKFDIKEVLILVIIMLVLTTLYTDQIKTIQNYDEQYLINTVPVTSQTGRVHAGCASFEYLPCKAFENRTYIETRTQDVITINGTVNIEKQDKKDSNMHIIIKDVTEQTTLELPYIYYPGYKIKLRYDGQVTNLKTFETDNGFVGITIPTLTYGIIDVEYTGTTIMKISSVISILGIAGFIYITFTDRIKNLLKMNKTKKKK